MKKKNNKGFSLIELIIAIAILVILTGLLAPQFMRYMEKSREAKDMQSLDTVYGAVQIALADEDAYKEVLKATEAVKALTTTGMTLEALNAEGLKTNDFVVEMKNTMGDFDAKRLWTSKAVIDANGAVDKNNAVYVYIDPDTFRVTVWIGKALAANAKPVAGNAINPDTAAIENVKTVGATFFISK